MTLRVRRAGPGDFETVLALIDGLADYESLTPPDAAGRERLREEMAAPAPRIEVLLAEIGETAVGYAAFFETFSTFTAWPKLYLEDIFVTPNARGSRAGYALFRELARVAVERGYDAIEWEVLDWNRLAIDFYERIGGVHQQKWLVYQLSREGIDALFRDEAAGER